VPELTFPAPASPTVSVVMVTYNAADWALRALRALVEHTDACYELIVVDNASSDGTPELLARELDEATLLLNERNRGFGPANNQGAGHARGEFLLFLNNDALVQRGWLPPLLDRMAASRTGAVGPRLLNLDGSLQIAGALLARSGSTLELGYGEDADAPEYRFPRVVDYLSGACLLVRRSAFTEVGGFDPVYGLGYFEDADLCLSLAERGYRVVFEPRSSVTHVRGASPRDELAPTVAARNRAIFRRRWSRVLASRPLSPLATSRRRTLAARDAPARERVLVVGELVESLVGRASAARVTVLARPGAALDVARVVDAGVEVVSDVPDWERWLEERRFHYDAIVASTLPSELEEPIRRTQPQAIRVAPESPDAVQLLARLDAVTRSVVPPG
jgi:GT2 family glycosyltransferase